MSIKVGNMIYCHASGSFGDLENTDYYDDYYDDYYEDFYNHDYDDYHDEYDDNYYDEQFCSEGNLYKIESIDEFEYSIIDDSGGIHSFNLNLLKEGKCAWFSVKTLLTERI